MAHVARLQGQGASGARMKTPYPPSDSERAAHPSSAGIHPGSAYRSPLMRPLAD